MLLNGPKDMPLSKLRLAVVDEPEVFEQRAKEYKETGKIEAFSIENEMRMLMLLKKMGHARLNKFNRTSFGDKEMFRLDEDLT